MLTTIIPLVAGVKFDIKGVLVPTASTPELEHLNSSISIPNWSARRGHMSDLKLTLSKAKTVVTF